jgi:hypothetical protein
MRLRRFIGPNRPRALMKGGTHARRDPRTLMACGIPH